MVVGLATRDGLSIEGMRYAGANARNPFGPQTVLNNPAVEAAVVESMPRASSNTGSDSTGAMLLLPVPVRVSKPQMDARSRRCCSVRSMMAVSRC